jgi:hypothetical protein
MNRLNLAAAGGCKTQSIVDDCCGADADRRILVLTYTRANQQELRDRLARVAPHSCVIDVQGWFGFLLSHWVRPYLPAHYAERRLRGFNFDGDPGRYATGEGRFLDHEDRAYRRHLAQLAFDVSEAADGAPVDRLAHIYDVVHIDEVQDLNGWDLEILRSLLASPIELNMVGDIRQAILFTNVHDAKNRQYKGIRVIDWFRAHEKAGRLKVDSQNVTWRSTQAIAQLADSVIDESLGFPATESRAVDPSGHTGIFKVAVADAERYAAEHDALCLRTRADTGGCCHLPYISIGDAKGLEAVHVLIWPTGPMLQFLQSGKRLATQSACKFYVAVTRARASVAFITDADIGFPAWTSDRASVARAVTGARGAAV